MYPEKGRNLELVVKVLSSHLLLWYTSHPYLPQLTPARLGVRPGPALPCPHGGTFCHWMGPLCSGETPNPSLNPNTNPNPHSNPHPNPNPNSNYNPNPDPDPYL